MKKKIVSVALVVALIAIAVGGTLAYFTDEDDATNTFTTGNVAIDLTEAEVEEDERGNLVAVATGKRHDVLDDEEDVYDYGKLYPGQTVYKDPTIENLGSEDAYIAAKIIVTDGEEADLNEIIGTGYENLLGIHEIISGGLVKENDTMKKDYNGLAPVYGDDHYSVYQTADRTNGVYVFYIFIEDIMAEHDSVTLFKEISIPADWDNEEMAHLADLTIKVEAYGTQAHGFSDCFEAMTKAFPEDFAFGGET